MKLIIRKIAENLKNKNQEQAEAWAKTYFSGMVMFALTTLMFMLSFVGQTFHAGIAGGLSVWAWWRMLKNFTAALRTQRLTQGVSLKEKTGT